MQVINLGGAGGGTGTGGGTGVGSCGCYPFKPQYCWSNEISRARLSLAAGSPAGDW